MTVGTDVTGEGSTLVVDMRVEVWIPVWDVDRAKMEPGSLQDLQITPGYARISRGMTRT